jgi:hypothetical protein
MISGDIIPINFRLFREIQHYNFPNKFVANNYVFVFRRDPLDCRFAVDDFRLVIFCFFCVELKAVFFGVNPPVRDALGGV